jgi:hypothetical protein
MTPFAAESRSTAENEKPTAYRGAGALIGGVLVVLFCGIGALDLIVESGTQDLTGASILLLVAVLAGLYGVYPAAFAWSDRLVVRNPFRTIELPWTSVTDLSARLSFIAHTEARRFTVWAIPVSLRERRRADRHRVRDLNQTQRAARRGTSPDAFQPSRGYRPVDPIERMSFADQAITEMNAKREAYCVQARLRAKAESADAGPSVSVEPSATAETTPSVEPTLSVESTPSAEPTASAETTVLAETTAPVDAAIVRWSWPSFALLGASVALLIVAVSLR